MGSQPVGVGWGQLPTWTETFSGTVSGYGTGYGYGYGYGYRDGDGYGYGTGYGYGDGYGTGYGYGYRDGYGYGYRDGYGAGYGAGYGTGDGYGAGYGAGDGDGYGYGTGYGTGDGTGYGTGYGTGDGTGYGYWIKLAADTIFRGTDSLRKRLDDLTRAGAFIGFWWSRLDGSPANGGSWKPVSAGDRQEIQGPLRLCSKGALHATLQPEEWNGERLWIVALEGKLAFEGDKVGALHREILVEVSL